MWPSRFSWLLAARPIMPALHAVLRKIAPQLDQLDSSTCPDISGGMSGHLVHLQRQCPDKRPSNVWTCGGLSGMSRHSTKTPNVQTFRQKNVRTFGGLQNYMSGHPSCAHECPDIQECARAPPPNVRTLTMRCPDIVELWSCGSVELEKRKQSNGVPKLPNSQ